MASRGAAARAPADFDARLDASLQAAIDAPQATDTPATDAPSWSRKRFVIAAVAVATLAASLLFVWWILPKDGEKQRTAALTLSVRSGDQPPLRSDAAVPGDILEIVAQVDSAAVVEIRVYHNDDLVTACGQKAPCQRRGNDALLSLPLELRGLYDVVLVRADGAVPKQGRSFDLDMAAAIEAGADVTSSRIVVR